MDALQNSPCRMQVDLDNLWNRSTLFLAFLPASFSIVQNIVKDSIKKSIVRK